MKKQLVIIIAILAATIALTSTLLFIAPSFSTPTINTSWFIVCNTGNTAHVKWIYDTYGGTIVNITEPQKYNNFGQNLLIIGGSHDLGREAPWIELWPTMEIIRPDTYPGVRFEWDYSLNAWSIVTPKTVYYPTSSNQLGFIARGYDYKLRRWIVVVLGYDWWGTAYGAKLICTQWDTVVRQNSYVIFKCTTYGGTETIPTYADFDGSIVEYGG
jgi:hypothetical protein